ncbi:MAG TPA: sigma-54 dependent transcriptional regulator [Longimicrobiaceae bacterium]|nr:sigma-54 dependent transcriptional regulator [Longimicrobiaceae bacterium]
MPPRRILALLPDGASDPGLDAGLASMGLEITSVRTLQAFLKALPGDEWAVALLSLSTDLVDEQIVERVARAPGCGALLLTTRGASLEAALLARRVGAIGLVQEPVTAEELSRRLEAMEDEGPEVSLPELEPDRQGAWDAPRLIGESPEMALVFETIAQVAGSEATVLLTGESGTGKEVVARVLHQASARSEGPFVAVNCAAIPEQLLETELFGHEKGAFTGATGSRVGRFERANGGTLFLDEIGDMSMVLQAKLLRALESRRVEPLGGTESRPMDARVIAATNQDLQDAMQDGSFREDLYFRLAVVELHLPPLRERPSDIRPLALHFTASLAKQHGRPLRAITEAALKRLREYAWPGNVRELRNVLDRAVLLAVGPVLGSGHLRLDQASPRISPRGASAAGAGYPTDFSLEQVEADHIDRVLAAHDGHLGRAAEVLGVHRNTLSRKLRSPDSDDTGE